MHYFYAYTHLFTLQIFRKHFLNSHEDIENDDDAAMSTLSTVHHPNSGFCIMIPNFRVGPVIVLGLISVYYKNNIWLGTSFPKMTSQ